MSSPTQIYPSSLEDVNAYLAAIRLASSVRNSMDAQKASVDREKPAVNADSYGRHHPNFPPPPTAEITPGGRGPVPTIEQTSSAHFASNTTKPGFVRPQDHYPPPSHSMSTGTWALVEGHASASTANFSTVADIPTGATLEALKRHHGHFPPPDPPMSAVTGPILEESVDTPADVKLEALEQHHNHFPPPYPAMRTGAGSIFEDTVANTPAGVKLKALEQRHGQFPPPEPPITQALPGKPLLRRTGPIPIAKHHGPGRMTWYVPSDPPPQCQLYVTNTGDNHTFAICPVTRRTTNLLHIRDSAMCEAPTGFDQRLACGQFDGWFVLAFFILFAMIGLAWMKLRKCRTGQLDEENGTATWPRRSNVLTNNPEAKPKPQASKVSINCSVDKLREKVRKAHEHDQRLDDEFGTKRYEPAAWRSTSHRAARAKVVGSVKHDAGPVAALPKLSTDLSAYRPLEPLPPHYESIDRLLT